jgi:hypothetical protein
MDLDLSYLTPERVSLVHLLQEAGVSVYADVGDCDIGDYAGYTMSEPANDTIMVVVCTETLREVHQNELSIRREINLTIDHEALHAAQFCALDGYPGAIDPSRNSEAEAVYYEGKPQAVGDKLIEFCF